jgi:hypothetical protein
MPDDAARNIFKTYMNSFAPDPVALADLYDYVGYPDPYLAEWLAKWGPAVMDDQSTLTAIRDAYDHDYDQHGDSDYVPSFPQLPSKARWTADELSPGTSEWKASLFSPKRNWVAYAQEREQGARPGTAPGQVAPTQLVPTLPYWPNVHGNTSEAKRLLQKINDVVGGITQQQLDKQAFMASRYGFDGFWQQIWATNDQNFLAIMKELYVNPQEKYDGLDFYGWVNRFIDEGRFSYFSLLKLYYAITQTLNERGMPFAAGRG